MKLKLILCSLAGLLLFGISALAAPDPNFYIYLCFGQSNMESGGKMDEMDRTVDKRFLVLADFDSTNRGWKKGQCPNSHVISSAGCASNDRLHFNSAGSREFGKRYGEKMLSLLGHQVANPRRYPCASGWAFRTCPISHAYELLGRIHPGLRRRRAGR